MKFPFVSIIIPTLNEEKYVESTLKALKNQDYRGKYEIIIADGMSKDNTVKIARKYGVKVILVKKRGIATERNAGANFASGDILLFLDSDVTLLPNALTDLLKAFKRNKVVVVGCTILPLSEKLTDYIIYWFFTQFAKITIKIKIPQMGGLLFCIRKDVFKKIGGFDEELTAIEDYDLSKKIPKYGKIIFINKPLALVSTRRVKKWGFLKATCICLKLYFNYILFRKSIKPKDYEPVR